MSMIETGTYGAKVQSWKRANPRDFLKRLIDDMPSANEAALFAEFRRRMHDDAAEDFLDTILEYWFANNYRSLITPPIRTAARIAARKATDAVVMANVTEEIQRKARLMLLDLVMPNGKALRDCTGRDCARFAGWHGKIAKLIKPSQKVGAALSESQLRKLAAR